MLYNDGGYLYLAYVPLEDAEKILRGALTPVDWLIHKGFTVITLEERYRPKGREPKKCFLGREMVAVHLPNGRILYGSFVLGRMKRSYNHWQLYVREGPHNWKRVRYVPKELAQHFIKYRDPRGVVNWLRYLGYEAHVKGLPSWHRQTSIEDEGIRHERIDRVENGTLIETVQEALE